MDDRKHDLRSETRERLARLDRELSAIWNLGDNVLLAWARDGDELIFLAVRHYAIPESVHAGDGAPSAKKEALRFINDLVSGPKQLRPEELERACRAFDCEPTRIRATSENGDESASVGPDRLAVSGRRYGAAGDAQRTAHEDRQHRPRISRRPH